MLRVAPVWLSGYAGVILLTTVVINVATALATQTFGLTLPFMRDSLGLSHTQEGSFISVIFAVMMVSSFIFGMLASRYGSRLIVGIAVIFIGVAMVLLGNPPSYLFAMAMSAVMGFASGAATTSVMGLLAVWFDSRNRGTAAGLAAAEDR